MVTIWTKLAHFLIAHVPWHINMDHSEKRPVILHRMYVDSERYTTELQLSVGKIENVNIVILKC